MNPPHRHNGHNGDYLLTVEDLAKLLKVSKRTVWRWCKNGRIPAPLRYSKISIRWRASDIQNHLSNQKSEEVAR